MGQCEAIYFPLVFWGRGIAGIKRAIFRTFALGDRGTVAIGFAARFCIVGIVQGSNHHRFHMGMLWTGGGAALQNRRKFQSRTGDSLGGAWFSP